MYPHERSLVEQMKSKPFALIGINSDKTLKRAKEAVKQNKLSWRNFQNKSNGRDIAKEWSVIGWPTVFVLDQKMKIHYRGYDFEAASKKVAELVAN